MKRLYQLLLDQHFQDHTQMAFLTGPRQAGKTTLVKSLKINRAQKYYFNWDISSDQEKILEGNKSVGQHCNLEKLLAKKPFIIFDEIHKYVHWKNFLKGFIDLYKGKANIAVTGSAKLNIYQHNADSLMGRYFLYRIHPLSIGECVRTKIPKTIINKPKKISKDELQALWNYSGFPEPFLKNDSYFFTKWQQMVNMLLFREDIRDLTNIQEIQQLELLSIILKNQAGSLVNLSKLAQKVQVSVMTIKRWLETLEQFFYCFQIRPWTTNINRSLLKEPKIYLWNWALITEEGSRFENFVACHLLKAVHFWTDVGIGKFDLYFLRDKDKNEVDFLVTRDDQPWFLAEAKLSSHQGISKSLYQFQEKTRAKHAFQITWNEPYVDEDCFIHDKPIIVPAQTFLSQLI